MAGATGPLVVGIAATAGALWIGLQRRDLALARAVIAALTCNVLVRSQVDAVAWLGTTVGVGCGLLLVIVGLRRRGRRTVRRAWIAAAATAAFVVLATAGAAVAGARAADDLRNGNITALDAVSKLSDGEYQSAADGFSEAAALFESAGSRLGAPWARPAMLVPAVAQNRTAALDLATAAADAATAIAGAATIIDLDQLTLRNGRVDIDAIALLAGPLGEVGSAVDSLSSTLTEIDSPWLLAPLHRRLTDLDADLDDYRPQLTNVVEAVERLPALLGGDGPRRYLVAFTTPAETRGLGGFMGNWTELEADDGAVRVAESGRTLDLNIGGDTPRVISGPADWLAMWGRYGFDSGPRGTTGPVPWSDVTVSPQFPSTGQVMAELYPQSGGRDVDGVFALDPYAIEALLGFAGPITIDGSDTTLTADNVVDFLLVDQYQLENDDRIDLLAEVSERTIGVLLAGSLPGPVQVADALGPLVDEGRIVGWAADPDEQRYFGDLGLTGALPSVAESDGVAVVFNNAGANKIDVYLQREVTYDATVDLATGATTATATVTLTNTAPSTGLPDSVLGNYTGDPPGTNRVLVSFYSALPVASASVERPDGSTADIQVNVGTEAGWTTGSTLLVVPSGESVTLTYHLAGTLQLDQAYSLAVRPQPMVIDEQLRVSVVDTDGEQLASFEGPSTRPQVLGGSK